MRLPLLLLVVVACGTKGGFSEDGEGPNPTGGTGPNLGGSTAAGGSAGSDTGGAAGLAGTSTVGGTGGTIATGGGAGDGASGTSGTPTGGASGNASGGDAGSGAGPLGGDAGTGGTAAGLGGSGGVGGAGGAMSTGGAAGKASTGGTGGAGSDPTCAIGVQNPSDPPQMLALTGSLGAHDPAVLLVEGRYYEFATGLGAKTSTDLLSWANATAPSRPAWVTQSVPAATNLWAPDISFFGGMYHLYYAASSFGSNHSCIGHATRASMTTGNWADQGSVVCSNNGTNDNWNAIDPNVIVDQSGKPYLDFGSFWSGIKMIELDMTGARMGTSLLSIANRPQNGGALEGPFIVWRCGYYYLFVSFDHCCDSPWNYNIRVGRSTSATGPYVDKAGTQMAQGGGTLLVTGDATHTAPGHNAVILTPNGAYNIYHALNASHGGASLRIAEMVWDAEGWPISAGP